MNEYLIRLALVIKTSHSKFVENLTSIIVYVIYSLNLEEKEAKIENLSNDVERISGLEFTQKEIIQVVNESPSYIYQTRNGRLILTEEGNKRIHTEKNKEFENIINTYIKEFDVSKAPEDVRKLIYEFLYSNIETNIEALLNVIKGFDGSVELFQLERLNNEERKIINDFIDWDNEQKNEMLYEIVSFAVDYCRLTVKKDKANFATFLKGKTFYLDTNIIFRMMGLNNVQRKETTLRFINKCKEAKIKLRITTFTKTETLNSIKYHVDQVKRIMRGYKGNGKALGDLYDKSSYEDGFLTAYLEWSKENGISGRYDDFYNDLKIKFYETINEIETEDAGKITIEAELLSDYMDFKERRITKENAEYDIKNLMYVDKKRKYKSDVIGWNVGEYFISADHKLIRWADNKFNKENPIVVLPSVWYSIILKLLGRANDDIKAFSEFIKIRYVQDKPTENIQYLINCVCKKTSNGVLQDMLFEGIANDNSQINNLAFSDNQHIEEVVGEVYDNILENTKNEGYISGKENGRKIGYGEGISQGEKIGRIKAEIDNLKTTVSQNSLKIRKRNITILFVAVIMAYGACIIFLCKCSAEWLNNLEIFIKLILAVIPSGVVGKILIEMLPFDLSKIKEIETEKIQAKINELERELKRYES